MRIEIVIIFMLSLVPLSMQSIQSVRAQPATYYIIVPRLQQENACLRILYDIVGGEGVWKEIAECIGSAFWDIVSPMLTGLASLPGDMWKSFINGIIGMNEIATLLCLVCGLPMSFLCLPPAGPCNWLLCYSCGVSMTPKVRR